MKTVVLVVLSICILLIGGLWMWRTFVPIQSQNQPSDTTSPFGEPGNVTSHLNGQPQSGSPNSGTGQPVRTVTITGADGKPIVIRDFSSDADLAADPSNPGLYELGYHPFATASSSADLQAPYYIEYIAATQTFVISLNQEPINQSRTQAEQYLMQKLGISQSQMCDLLYSLSVPNVVNSYYAGKNLGFSFCPGAVQLPQ